MKTLYLSSSYENIYVDKETDECGTVPCKIESVRRIYLAEEAMHVVYQEGEYKREFNVEPNDIIVTFYSKDFKNRVVVVKNPEWVENIVEYENAEQARKEEWAKKQADNDCPVCGDSCESKF